MMHSSLYSKQTQTLVCFAPSPVEGDSHTGLGESEDSSLPDLPSAALNPSGPATCSPTDAQKLPWPESLELSDCLGWDWASSSLRLQQPPIEAGACAHKNRLLLWGGQCQMDSR